ncbi:MAG: ATP synthase F1 subunit gamma [Eubacteriales bacterium]|nr:ATP synthase F1 subunit gamma [Eubacteriales bacterium]
MNSVEEINHHIKVVQDTRKITRAMYLISSSRTKRALRLNESNKLYFQRVRSNIRFIIENSGDSLQNPYFRQHPGKQVAYLVIAGDKGLCGSYNTEILKLAEDTIKKNVYRKLSIYTIGHIASEFFYRMGMKPDTSYIHILYDPNLRNAREITAEMCRLFRGKHLDEIYAVYTLLGDKNVLKPTVLRLLPVLKEDFLDAEILHKAADKLLYHPTVEEVFESIVPHYLVGLVYSILVQSYESEHFARMMAMEASTDNADEMLAEMKMEMNHARQAEITREISEIISGIPACCRLGFSSGSGYGPGLEAGYKLVSGMEYRAGIDSGAGIGPGCGSGRGSGHSPGSGSDIGPDAGPGPDLGPGPGHEFGGTL